MGQSPVGSCRLCMACFILIWSLKSSLLLSPKLGNGFSMGVISLMTLMSPLMSLASLVDL